MSWWQKLLMNALIFIALAGLVPGFYVSSFSVALGAAVILGLLNIFVRPILSFLTIPINFLSFGLFSIVINALMLSTTSFFMGGSFSFSSFWVTLLVAALMSLFNNLLENNTH